MSKALNIKDYNIKTIERSRTTVLCTLHNAVGLGIINNWRACDDFFWVGGDKTQAKPESPPTQKKAELRIVRVRVPPSDGTEARGGSLGRARMCVCVCGTLACELEYEVCSGRRLLRMLGFCIRIVTYLWEITRIPLE